MTVHDAYPVAAMNLAARLNQARLAFPGFRPLIDANTVVATYLGENDYDTQGVSQAIARHLKAIGHDLPDRTLERLRFYPPPQEHLLDTLDRRLRAAALTPFEALPKLSHPKLKDQIMAWQDTLDQLEVAASLLHQDTKKVVSSVITSPRDWRALEETLHLPSPYDWVHSIFEMPAAWAASRHGIGTVQLTEQLLESLKAKHFIRAVRAMQIGAARFREASLKFMNDHLPAQPRTWTEHFEPFTLDTQSGDVFVREIADANLLASMATTLNLPINIATAALNPSVAHVLVCKRPDAFEDACLLRFHFVAQDQVRILNTVSADGSMYHHQDMYNVGPILWDAFTSGDVALNDDAHYATDATPPPLHDPAAARAYGKMIRNYWPFPADRDKGPLVYLDYIETLAAAAR